MGKEPAMKHHRKKSGSLEQPRTFRVSTSTCTPSSLPGAAVNGQLTKKSAVYETLQAHQEKEGKQ